MTFVKGRSGNPGGKPAKRIKQLSEMLAKDVPTAVAVLRELLHKKDYQLAAAKEILDRVYGKAPQSVTVSGDITIIVNLLPKKLAD